MLLQNEHYSIHREMLPFIGSNFDDNRILIVAESHYVPKSIKHQLGDEWYDISSSDFIKKTLQNNTNSRGVIAQISKGKGHGLFHNIGNALKAANQKYSLNDIAWYNFYQKPAEFGKSIKPTELDKKKAISVFETILDVLKPKLVIFVSRLSFNELKGHKKWNKEKNGHIYKNFNIPMCVVPHPTCQWWNKESFEHKDKNGNSRTGKQKFIDIIKEHFL